ncbi:nucleolar protein 12-domain-containing protein, partial [Cytidiella melzeri]
SSNLSVLTKSHNIIAAKKRARKDQVKEVLFDETARREYLTGFHKRNVQKKEAKKKNAIEREKQQRLETRREHRKLLAEQATKNYREVEKAYGAQMSDDEDADWDGISDKGKGRAAEHEEEYEGEEQLATVTVVEDFDPESLIHGPSRHAHSLNNSEDTQSPQPSTSSAKPSRITTTDLKKTQSKTAAKAKPAKYQTNAARKADRSKQLKRKTEKAQRAGGK